MTLHEWGQGEDAVGGTLESLHALCTALHQASIRYCRWKGSASLAASLEGETDLDLLVDGRDFAELAAMLWRHGFKLAHTPTSRHQPGVFHFLGADPTGRLTNVHLYSRILVGEELVERWALPFERILLEATRTESGLRLPSREAEFVTFLLRDLVRHGTLVDIALLRRNRVARQQQIAWLFDGVDLDEATAILGRAFPEVEPRDLARAIELLRRGAGPLRTLRTARRVRRSLRKYRLSGTLSTMWRRADTIVRMVTNRIRGSRKHMRLVTGGKLIAVVGPQATGKSTIASALRDWLGSELEVYVIHAGKPSPGLLTSLPTALIPALRRLAPGRRTYEIERRMEAGDSRDIPYSFLVRKLMVAWDRRRLLGKAFRRTRRGAVVISDRYPSDTPGAIDSVSFSADDAGEQPRLKGILMRWEARLYRDIASPDVVIQLTLPLEQAVVRNIERDRAQPHTTSYVVQRHTMTARPSFSHAPVFDVSTDRDLEETLGEVKGLVWANL